VAAEETAERNGRAVAKLQALVRIPTVSNRDPALVDTDAFDRLLVELEHQFPLLHERLELTRIPSHALLFRWPGASSERPVVLMAHLDVVPVEGTWRHPPFDGVVADGIIWGRGTLDDKGCVVAICEAVEALLAAGHVPAQDVWLSFGCEEEVSPAAATLAVDELERRGVRPWFVLDEGGAVAADAFPGVAAPVGVIGVTEKGVTSVELRVEGRGGHASTPARMAPTARLARAITRIDRSPMSAGIPVRRLSTPSGRPASSSASASRMAHSGVMSDGLKTTVLPNASAGAIFHAGMAIGKFHGVITQTTPSGSRKL